YIEIAPHALAGHGAAVGKPEDMVVMGDAGGVETPPQQQRELRLEEAGGKPGTAPVGARCRVSRLEGKAHRLDAEFGRELDEDALHDRVKMEVVMRVDMVERQAGAAEGVELRANLGGGLAPRLTIAEDADAGCHGILGELAAAIDESRDLAGRKDGGAVDQHEMEADAEPRQTLGARHRIRRRGARHHEARRSEDAAGMARLDRLVHRLVEAEIIRRDDELLQKTCSRQTKRTAQRREAAA